MIELPTEEQLLAGVTEARIGHGNVYTDESIEWVRNQIRLRPKLDEKVILFLKACGIGGRQMEEITGIHTNRVYYVLLKWSDKGFYDYGVNAMVGWLHDEGYNIYQSSSVWPDTDEVPYGKALLESVRTDNHYIDRADYPLVVEAPELGITFGTWEIYNPALIKIIHNETDKLFKWGIAENNPACALVESYFKDLDPADNFVIIKQEDEAGE